MRFGKRFSRVATVFAVGFGTAMLSWVTWRVFGANPPDIATGTATAYAAFVGSVPATAWGAYKWARRSERS